MWERQSISWPMPKPILTPVQALWELLFPQALFTAVRRDGAVKIFSQRMSDWLSVKIIELSMEKPLTWPGSATNARYSRYAGLLLSPAEGLGFWKWIYWACYKKNVLLRLLLPFLLHIIFIVSHDINTPKLFYKQLC